MPGLSQVQPDDVKSAERALNAELNQLFDEKNELLKKIENQKDALIINKIQSMRVKMDEIDKNKEAFYSKLGNKKYEQ